MKEKNFVLSCIATLGFGCVAHLYGWEFYWAINKLLIALLRNKYYATGLTKINSIEIFILRTITEILMLAATWKQHYE